MFLNLDKYYKKKKKPKKRYPSNFGLRAPYKAVVMIVAKKHAVKSFQHKQSNNIQHQHQQLTMN